MNDSMILPAHYISAIRALLRFALVMVIVGLLSGIAFQESSKKMPRVPSADGLSHLDAVIQLALVHGHIFVTGVLTPVVMATMLYLGRACGGGEVGGRALRWSVNLYLLFLTGSILLMFYKGYHVLLSARFGETNLDAIYGGLFGGSKFLRYGLYGLCHVGMGIALGAFAWFVWRSMRLKST